MDFVSMHSMMKGGFVTQFFSLKNGKYRFHVDFVAMHFVSMMGDDFAIEYSFYKSNIPQIFVL